MERDENREVPARDRRPPQFGLVASAIATFPGYVILLAEDAWKQMRDRPGPR